MQKADNIQKSFFVYIVSLFIMPPKWSISQYTNRVQDLFIFLSVLCFLINLSIFDTDTITNNIRLSSPGFMVHFPPPPGAYAYD